MALVYTLTSLGDSYACIRQLHLLNRIPCLNFPIALKNIKIKFFGSHDLDDAES